MFTEKQSSEVSLPGEHTLTNTLSLSVCITRSHFQISHRPLQTHRQVQLYAFFRFNLLFLFHHNACFYAQVRFRHQKHLVMVMKTSRLA